VKLALVSLAARESPEALPLGLACVAAAIKAAATAHPASISVESFLLEAALGESPDALASRIASSGAGIVGFSVYSWNRETLAKTALRLRGAMGGMLLFAGGPEATADPLGLVAEAALDFAIAGEGESAIVAVLSAILSGGALNDIPGVVLAGASTSSEPFRMAPPEDAAKLPSPWLFGVLDPKACGGDVLWELSRGCPFRCAYCYESKGHSGVRPFPTQRIEAELELFVRSGVRYAFVLDPTFDADVKRAAALLDLFREKAPLMRWKFEVRAELLDKGLIRRFAALDCSLQIGLQSAQRGTLETIGRPGFDRAEFARKTAMLGSAGVSFGLDLIYGLPGDALRDFEESLDFALGLEPNHLDLFPLALLPGTELFDRAEELGIEADPLPPYLVRATREMPSDAMARAASLAAACDRFYGAGRAVGWFRAALRPLRARPSVFLRDFASWLSDNVDRGSSDSRSIEAEQLGFLDETYAAAGLDALLPALRDLLRLHGAWGRALAEGEESFLDLSYDPEEVLGSAVSGLAAFVRSATPLRARWRVLPDELEGARIERTAAAILHGSQAITKSARQRAAKPKQ
jgi:radical SAM superfamily enzyme YgiQ (UPF0313 family)